MEPDTTLQTTTQDLLVPFPSNQGVYFTQLFARILVWPIRLCFGRGAIVDIDPKQIDKKSSYIIAANHGSWFDPLVIMHHFPKHVFQALGPFRVMVLNKLFDSIMRPLIAPLGSFPAKPHRRYRHGLDLAKYYMDKGTTIAIFPEGRRNLDGSVKPRRGVAELTSLDGAKLIPVHIEWMRHFFGLVPAYKIHLGAPIITAGMSAEQIMDKIYGLQLP